MHYGGFGSVNEDVFDYKGGLVKEDMIMDPDYVTWSIFDEFCEQVGISGLVEKIWYKLRHEETGSARVIYNDKDSQIRQMCLEGLTTGEIDKYIHQVGVGEHEEDDDEDHVDAPVEDKGEDPIEEVNDDDPRLQGLFEDGVRADVADVNEGEGADAAEASNVNEVQGVTAHDDDPEFERQCVDDEHPDPALDTDDEWDAFHREERVATITSYAKDKPPYLWKKQTFNSEEEFKDQLLRYVLKTNYDVKLSRWGNTKLAAVCRHEGCNWLIYCSLEKPKHKWMVKTYYDSHHHNKSSKATMLKQGVIARLFRDEARRRPGFNGLISKIK